MSQPPVIAVLDYGMGNRRSVHKALEHVGAEVVLTADHRRLRAADALVVPGVGAFPLAMQRLKERELADVIRELAAAGKPLLGICLGMQLLFERSLELERSDGLGLLGGEVTPLDTDGLRVPHIGWNEVRFERASALAPRLAGQTRAFYHVHSLVARPAVAADVVATTSYGERFATIVERDNVIGVQFHPEKSSSEGLALLRGFVALGQRRRSGPRHLGAARA
jgi:imidazole glycerol-phosphate synthase subunit HisH